MSQPNAPIFAEKLDDASCLLRRVSLELRLLHAANVGLIGALKDIAAGTYDSWSEGANAQRIAQAALEKHWIKS